MTARLLLLMGPAMVLAACSTPNVPMAATAPQPRSIGTPPPRSAATGLSAMMAAAATATNPYVGGAKMMGTRTIADNCAAAPNLRQLARALNAGGGRAALSSAGPITVFAPSDEAFGRLALGAVDQLLAPANRAALAKVLNYHVVPGAITLADLRARIDAGGGRTQLTTLDGEPLLAARDGDAIALTDVNGNKSYVETPDVQQVNGVIHVVNGLLVPRLG